jgi:hypothetical protein
MKFLNVEFSAILILYTSKYSCDVTFEKPCYSGRKNKFVPIWSFDVYD